MKIKVLKELINVKEFTIFAGKVDGLPGDLEYYDCVLKTHDYDFQESNVAGKRIWELAKFMDENKISFSVFINNPVEPFEEYTRIVEENISFNEIKEKYGEDFHDMMYNRKDDDPNADDTINLEDDIEDEDKDEVITAEVVE